MKILVIVHSYHHGNTEKIARAIAGVLKAEVTTVGDVNAEDVQSYDLVGFGSGIAYSKHYPQLLRFADGLRTKKGGTAFIFSTAGVAGTRKNDKNHTELRSILTEKGYSILGEFACKGYDTYGILSLMGGLNKGRPNAEDIKAAEEFARSLVL